MGLADFGDQANATLNPMIEEQEDEHEKKLRELYARGLRDRVRTGLLSMSRAAAASGSAEEAFGRRRGLDNLRRLRSARHSIYGAFCRGRNMDPPDSLQTRKTR